MVLFITSFCILVLCSSFLNLMFFLFISLVSYIQSQLTSYGTRSPSHSHLLEAFLVSTTLTSHLKLLEHPNQLKMPAEIKC